MYLEATKNKIFKAVWIDANVHWWKSILYDDTTILGRKCLSL